MTTGGCRQAARKYDRRGLAGYGIEISRSRQTRDGPSEAVE
jgi:hypothetical protein